MSVLFSPPLFFPSFSLFLSLFPSFSSPSLTPSPTGAVVVGLDINFNYKKLALAELYITQQNAQFIGTNGDTNYPYARGQGEPKVLLPGGGVMVGALGIFFFLIIIIFFCLFERSLILLTKLNPCVDFPSLSSPPTETCTKTKAKIMGKPTPYMFELIQKEHHISPSSCIFMGDNLLTDIKFGNHLGIRTVFLLSGVSLLEEVDTLGIVPTYIAKGVYHFLEKEEK